MVRCLETGKESVVRNIIGALPPRFAYPGGIGTPSIKGIEQSPVTDKPNPAGKINGRPSTDRPRLGKQADDRQQAVPDWENKQTAADSSSPRGKAKQRPSTSNPRRGKHTPPR